MRTLLCVLLIAIALSIGAALLTGIMSVSTEQTDEKFIVRMQVPAPPFQRARVRTVDPPQVTAAAKMETATGIVSEYEDGAQSFVLSTSDHRELTMHLDSMARISGKRLAGLQVGDRVSVIYTTSNGEHTAISVTVE